MRCWSRFGKARSGASCGPRSPIARARRAASPPEGRPRHRERSRASGSSAREAPAGEAPPGRGRRPRRRAEPPSAARARAWSGSPWRRSFPSSRLDRRTGPDSSPGDEFGRSRRSKGYDARFHGPDRPSGAPHRRSAGAPAPSTRSSAAGARSGSTPAMAPTWRSSWAADSAAAIVECETPRPLWLPYVEVADIAAATERARHARRLGPARAPRRPGRVAKCRRHAGRRGGRLLAAKGRITDDEHA